MIIDLENTYIQKKTKKQQNNITHETSKKNKPKWIRPEKASSLLGCCGGGGTGGLDGPRTRAKSRAQGSLEEI